MGISLRPASKVLAINTRTYTLEEFGESLPKECYSWNDGVVGADMVTVFGVPLNADGVLAIDTESMLLSLVSVQEGQCLCYMPSSSRWLFSNLVPL